MKKKKHFRILSVLLCFMFLFFVGCDGGPGGLTGDSPRSLDGVKVLSKPADYSFSEAVGNKASENYYNLFARELLYQIYGIYNNQTGRNSLYDDIDADNGLTFNSTDATGKLKFYLLDSLRYTITHINTTRNADDEITAQNIAIDLGSAWNWAPVYNESGKEIIFENADIKASGITTNLTGDTLTINLDQAYTDEHLYSEDGDKSTWVGIYNFGYSVNYQTDYAFGDEGKVTKGALSDVVDYWYSPYYQQQHGQIGALTAENHYQDALEYVTYLFVLGYEFDGTQNDEYKFFNIEKSGMDLVVADIQSPANKISVTQALGKVKNLYNEMGGYVGIKAKDKTQIAQFIKKIVIGDDAYAKNQFTVTFNNSEPSLSFNRNYDQIIENIIRYACEQAPIGFDSSVGERGKSLNLDEAYLASEITDYAGDYFFQSYENNSDENLFRYIEAAEYQSMVLYPRAEDFGKPMTDFWLAFEYYDYGNAPGKTCADSITINVGFRYFDKNTGTYAFTGETQIVVQYGLTGTFIESNGEESMPDKHWVYITDFEDVLTKADNGIHEFKQGILLDTKLPNMSAFNKNIGNGVLNPMHGWLEPIEKASKTINGTDDTRKYYKLNDSSTYGTYGTLNEQMFSVQNAGNDACDFMEVYFDINKEKGKSGVNYNFKVAMVGFFAEESAY